MRHARRSLTLVVALLALSPALAGCGAASDSAARRSTAEPTPPALRLEASPHASDTSSRIPDAELVPGLSGTGTATPPAFRPPRTRNAAYGADAEGLINLVYDAWMIDVSGLFANLTQQWVSAVAELATPAMTRAAQRSAAALQQAHDHALGTLEDSHRIITVRGSSATLTDCLDELHWYVVEDANGQPDPSVTRAYFVGTADFVLAKGQWRLSSWNSHTERCSP
jgi:hypothetical protein